MAQANLDIRIRVKDDGSLIIDRVSDRLDTAGKKAGGFAAEASKAFRAMRTDLLQVWAAVELGSRALRALEDFGSAFLDAARLAENYRTRLEVLMGSQREANDLFEAMRKYAARVPFELRDIVGAATQLAGVVRGGADEVARLMPLIGDLAAASGLSIRETTSQVIRMWSAGAQAADMFRERGILAMLGFRAGVSYSIEETRRQLLAAWEAPESRFRGATERMAANWDGMVSMIEDKWFQFQAAVMDAGVFDALKVQTLEWDRALADMLAPDGTLTKAAELVGRMADEWFGVTRLKGRIAAIGEEIADLQGRLQGAPSGDVGFLGVLGQEWRGTLRMDQAEIQARIRELQAERERLERWLNTVERARDERRRTGEGPGGAAASPAGAPLWIDPTESAERWGALWAEKAWKARARAMAQLAKSAPPEVEWIDPTEGAERFSELVRDQADKIRALTDNATTNPLRRLKEVSEEDKRVIAEVGEWVKKWAEWKAQAEKDWTEAAVKGLTSYRDNALDTYDEVRSAVEGAFLGMEDALVRFVETGKISFKSFADSVISDLARIAIRAQITGPLAQMFGGFFGAPAPATPAAPTSTPFPSSSPSIGGSGWWNAPVPRLAPRTGAGAPGIGNVTVINNGAPEVGVTVTERTGPGGLRDVEVLIDRTVAGAIDRGGDTAQAIQRVFGLTRRGY